MILGPHLFSEQSARSLSMAPSFPSDLATSQDVSSRMRRIGGKDTTPEIIVRRIVHSLGYRFRLHRRDLPGSPDLVFPSKRKAIWVHGCFWHRHVCATGQRRVRTHTAYWDEKFERTRLRDARKESELRTLGWDTLTLWECEVVQGNGLEQRVIEFLGKWNAGKTA